MAFTDRQKINMFTKALIAGVIDSESIAAWYESFFPFTFIMDSAQVWLQMDLLKQHPAPNIPTARTNVANHLQGVVDDLSQNVNAVRLSLMTGSNGTTWVAYSTYNDTSSEVLKNWLLPQLIPQSNGSPSNGYGILLYNGDPNAGGTLISTTTGATGTGETASQSWIFNYANGLLFISPDFTGTVNDPYIVGFRYIGKTVKDLGTVSGDITALAQSIQDNANDIQNNATAIQTNSTDIATNNASITTNAGDITQNATDIATNITDIATNVGNISTNTTSISTNAGNISTNTTNITANTGDISTNTGNISANATDISTNATDIQTNADNISALQGDVATINTEITGLGDRITDVEVKIGTSGLTAKFVKR